MTFGACVAYLIDVMHSRSSEMMATIESVLFRFVLESKELNDLLAYCVLLYLHCPLQLFFP